MSVTEHRSLPACPNNPQLRQYIAYPSTVFVFVIIALSSLLFAIFVGFKYNSVRIFNRFVVSRHSNNTFPLFWNFSKIDYKVFFLTKSS
jgi:hypothetical protein